MADFLASFNFGAADDKPTRDEACVSLDEVQARFRELFLGRVTETRAEHIRTTLDIASATQFTIYGGQGENVDPSLGQVSAREALVSQPQRNPTVQKAVSQEILNAIGAVDSSTWSIDNESRNTQGWVLTYSCIQSWNQWTRTGKTAQKHAVMDYSQKELDLTSRARPAFDCRGSISFIFSKTNGAITINYSHSPIHRTVGEMYDMFQPLPPPHSSLPKKKAPGSAKKSDTPRSKRPATDTNGESVPKKRSKKPKSNAKNQLSQAELVPIRDGDFVTTEAGPIVTMGDSSDHIALAALSAAVATESVNHSLVPNIEGVSTAKNNTASLNVSPEEAARRREVATTKLTEAGISLSSLSDDQFSIFSNQSPEVQVESLKMLVKYGAERLHIVHPAKKNSPLLPASQPVDESVASGSVNPQLLGNEIGNEIGNSTGALDELFEEPIAVSKKPQKAKGGSKSRVFCFNCKLSKSKCSKDRPTCTVCQDSGLSCEYPAGKPRAKKPVAIVVDEDDTIVTENLDAEGEEDDEATAAPGFTEIPDLRQPPAYDHSPIANMMQITPDDQGNGSRPIGETTTKPTIENRVEPSSFSWSLGSSGLAFPYGRAYYPTTTTNDTVQNNAGATAETGRTTVQHQAATSTSKGRIRVPTPTPGRLAEPPRERHESPLERHNPMRHETYQTYQRSPLTMEKVPPANPYSEAVHSQHSDRYKQNSSYENHQGNYPQLDDTASDRIAYDPNAHKQNTASRSFTPHQPGIGDHSPSSSNVNSRIGLPNRQEESVTNTLQRFYGYGNDNGYHSNVMLPVHAPSQQRDAGGIDTSSKVMVGVSKHGAHQKAHQSQPEQSKAAQNHSQQGQQQSSWYRGQNRHHNSSSGNAYQNQNWRSGHGSWS